MSFKFREHRGGLAESMETLVVMEDWNELAEYCKTKLSEWMFNIRIEDVSVKPYADNPDTRIGWDKTYIVMVEGWGPFGFTDKDVPRNEPRKDIDGTDTRYREESKPPSSDRKD